MSPVDPGSPSTYSLTMRRTIARFRAALRTLRQSAARFEHRGVVVSYAGLVLDQTAVAGAVDAALDGLPRHSREAGTGAARGIRVAIVAETGADVPPMTAVWRAGLFDDVGEVRVVADASTAENVRAGLAALVRSRVGLPPEPVRSQAVA